MKRILPILLVIGIFVGIYFFFLRGGSTAQAHARHFCECSVEMSKAEARKKAERIEEAEYQQVRQAHIQCMGNEDPRKKLSTPSEKQAFEREFLLEIKRQCPDVGRNFGYRMDD